ncbi:unnamed protein product, partial [Haemonchus placei]|uniref:REJ domain-containing protein n=1 Tax=Haemonchus placei TaxID=6290 RepID=A0A0N4VVZ4_HAEPC
MPTTRSQSTAVPALPSDSRSSSPSPPSLTGTGAAAPDRVFVASSDSGAAA